MSQPIRIVVCRGETEVHNEVYRQEKLNIGKRELSNDVVLDAQGVSRCHATVCQAPEGLVLEDLKSTNGTYVDGTRVEKIVLRGEEVIAIGPFQVRIRAERGDAETEASTENESSQCLKLIEREPSKRLSLDELAPLDFPEEEPEQSAQEEPPVEIPRREKHRRTLASLYRDAASRCGAYEWGLPSSGPDNATLAQLREDLAHTRLGPQAQVEWLHRVTGELDGNGPLPTLLADGTFRKLTVCGTRPIEVEREDRCERLPLRYSCAEALTADVRRLFGDSDGWLSRHQEVGNYRVNVIGSDVVLGGFTVVARRIVDVEAQGVVFGDAEDYVSKLMADGRTVLVVGSSTSLNSLLSELVERMPDSTTATHVQRSWQVRGRQVFTVDGFAPPEKVWSGVSLLRRKWLLVDDVNMRDLAWLVTHRESCRGWLVTMSAQTIDQGLERLKSFAVCAGLVPLEQSFRFLQQLFDVCMYTVPSGEDAAVASIQELRGGEVVEIFTRESTTLSATGVESELLS